MKNQMLLTCLCGAIAFLSGCGESDAVRANRVEKVQSVLTKNANELMQDLAKTLKGSARELMAKVKVSKVDVVLGEKKSYTASIALDGSVETKSIEASGKEHDDGKIEYAMNQNQMKAVLGEILEAGDKKDAEIAAAKEAASWYVSESAIQKYISLRDFACREPYRSRRIGRLNIGATYKYDFHPEADYEIYKVLQVIDGGVLAIMDVSLDPSMSEYTSMIILVKTKRGYVTDQRLGEGFYAYRGTHTYQTTNGGSNTVYVFQDVTVKQIVDDSEVEKLKNSKLLKSDMLY